MNELYEEEILDHFENPRNKGELDKPDVVYKDHNPFCGDEVEMQLKVQDGKVEQICFNGHGCTISMACASMITEKVRGMSLADIVKMTRDDVNAMLGIPLGPVRTKCAMLPLKAAKAAAYTSLAGSHPDGENLPAEPIPATTT